MADKKLRSFDPVIALRYGTSFPRRVLFLHMPLQLRLSAESFVASLDFTLYFASARTRVRVRSLFGMMM